MFDDLKRFLCLGQVSCFDGDDGGDPAGKAGGDGGSGGGDGGDGGTAGGDGGTNGKAGGSGGGGDGEKSFKQDDVDRIVQERLSRERKQNAEKYQDLEGRYTTLLDNQNLSEEERSKLETNLEDVRKRLRTKEEEAKHQITQVKNDYEQQLAKEKADREMWEKRFYDSSIQRALQDAAVTNDAYNASQVVSLLKPMTKLRRRVDETTGKDTDDFETVIDFVDQDEHGLQVVTQRTPDETVKRMKELSSYANLFKSNVVSGVGANSATGGIAPGANGRIDVRTLTPEQYKKIRKDNPELLGLAPKKS